jgi:hypothetical protein
MTDDINCGKVGNVKITRVVEAEGGFPGGCIWTNAKSPRRAPTPNH